MSNENTKLIPIDQVIELLERILDSVNKMGEKIIQYQEIDKN